MFVYDTRNQEEEKMRKNVKKVIAPLLAAAMALSCTVCVLSLIHIYLEEGGDDVKSSCPL